MADPKVAAERARLELDNFQRNGNRWLLICSVLLACCIPFIPAPYLVWVVVAGLVAGLAMAQRLRADLAQNLTLSTLMRLLQLVSAMSVGLPVAAVLGGAYGHPAVKAFAILLAMLAAMGLSNATLARLAPARRS